MSVSPPPGPPQPPDEGTPPIPPTAGHVPDADAVGGPPPPTGPSGSPPPTGLSGPPPQTGPSEPTSPRGASSNRIEISADELATPEVDERVRELRAAASPPLVRSVGAATPAPQVSWWRGGVASLALAGLLGGLAGWFISELIVEWTVRPFDDDPAANVAVWMALYAVGLAAFLTGWDGIEGRNAPKMLESWKRGIPVTAVGAFVGGFVAQKLYEPFFERALERSFDRSSSPDEFFELMNAALRVPRGLGFLVAGAVVGVALGVAVGAKQKAINGAIGGAVGGFAGGLLFSFVTLGGGGAARAVSLTVTGVVIGAAIGLVEEARKEVWLEITNGGMAGKQFILYHDETSIGAAPGCHVTLIKDPHIAAHHASVVRGPAGPEIRAATPGVPLLVNGQATERAPIRDGDAIQLGATLLRLGLREQAMPTVAGGPPR